MAADRLHIVTQVAPYSDGPAGVHGVLDQSAVAIAELARMVGMEPVHVHDVAELAPRDLEAPGVLCLFTIGETPWSDEQRSCIVAGLRQGRLQVIGIHAATDACHGWEEYRSLVGARFAGHPWTQVFEVEVLDPTHPSTRHLDAGFSWHDEVYLFEDLRADARVLLQVADGQLDMAAEGARRPEHGFPLAWCFTEGKGRAFYTSLGHFPDAWETPSYLRHLLGGLMWVRAEDT